MESKQVIRYRGIRLSKERIELGKVSGEYKGKHYTVEIGATGTDTKVFCEGKDVTNGILTIDLTIRPNRPTILALTMVEL